MTFKQIELFVLVCQYKSITRVSEANFVSPQSISRMIKDLEIELNTTLLHRTNTGLIPTKSGEYFCDGCTEILARKDNLIENILHLNTETIATIHIGMATGSISALNYHIFDNFQSAHPNIKIKYEEYIDSELKERYLNDEFDFCITTHLLDENLYQNTKILTEEIYLSIPKEHNLYNASQITLKDLQDYEFVMFTNDFHIREKFISCFETAGMTPNIKISLKDFDSIKNLAYKNNLLTLDVQHSLKKEHGFRHVLFPCHSLTYELWMIKKLSDQSDISNSLCQYMNSNYATIR